MNLRTLLGWGIVIYAILHVVWTALVVNGLAGNFFARAVLLGTLVALAAIATRALRFSSERDVLPYAIGWVVISAAMDAIVTVPTSGWGIYGDWNLWVGYILLLAVPLVVTAISKRPDSA